MGGGLVTNKLLVQGKMTQQIKQKGARLFLLEQIGVDCDYISAIFTQMSAIVLIAL